eukprot:TRINITY_DN33105_c0_g1_i1.p1 TRINITY_DN33105_c0_g1~~TRINITY_DN33105_c0_g1_i1.p1  ORF type:complete len:129 (+),score=16.58 TRINITY_DN33105_c0_g1_i1:28-414(+)
MDQTVLLGVNGTLMQGLELEPNMINAGAVFVKEAKTKASYRFYSINDVHPAMVRVAEGGIAVHLEVWKVPLNGLASILINEPPGLCIGKVTLDTDEEILGVIGESILCETQKDISDFGNWREYIASLK